MARKKKEKNNIDGLLALLLAGGLGYGVYKNWGGISDLFGKGKSGISSLLGGEPSPFGYIY